MTAGSPVYMSHRSGDFIVTKSSTVTNIRKS